MISVDITQSMLETLVPKTGNSHVMVVGGKKKGEVSLYYI